MSDTKTQDLKVTVVDTQPCSMTMTVEIPQAEVAKETSKVFNEIQKVAQVPGFRQGKAPLDLVKKNYVKTAREKVIENLIHSTVFDALKSQGVDPIDAPRIEEIDFDFEKPFSFRMKAERHPQFKVQDYKGIKIKKEIHPINDEKVNETLESLRDRNSTLAESSTGIAGDKSFVMVSYTAFEGATELPDLAAKNQLIDLSAPQALQGFKEGLTGAKKDDEKEIKVTFPADSPNKKLAGKEVVFKVKVQEVKEKQLPALDDEFAKDMGLQSLDELKTKVRESLEADEKKRQDQEVEKQIIDHLVEANKIAVPDSMVEDQLQHLLARMFDYFRRQGMPDSALQKNLPQWREKYKAEAERNVKLSYILNAVAADEKIEVSDEDLAQELEKMKKANPGREADVEKYFNENKKHMASSLKEEKLFKFLIEQSKMKEETK